MRELSLQEELDKMVLEIEESIESRGFGGTVDITLDRPDGGFTKLTFRVSSGVYYTDE
jgi:hypothetical protein